MNGIIKYISDNIIEVTGMLLSLIYVYLSIKQRISTWIFGFLCSALYVIVFIYSKFYAGAVLQLYYVAVSIYGWISWRKNKTTEDSGLPVTQTKGKVWIYITFISGALFLVLFLILKNYTDSPIPVPDAVTTALSIIATWMLARKLIENWIFWIFIDFVSTGMYIYRGLYATAGLFVIYTVMAVVGYIEWSKLIKKTE